MAIYINQIRMLQKQLKALDKSITDLCAVIDGSQSTQSIPGVGPVYSAGLLAEVVRLNGFRVKLVWQAMPDWFGAEVNPETVSGN